MGYDLSNEKGHGYRWNIWGWGSVFNLALSYDWQPLGTELDLSYLNEGGDGDYEGEEWEGGYFSNDGQLVSKEDAEGFAKALESSLDDIPDRDVRPKISGKMDESFFEKRKKIWEQQKASLLVEFSGEESKKYLRGFISFLREGSFRIY